MLIIMTGFCIILYTFLCSDHIALLKAFEGWKDANHNGKKPVTLQMTKDMRMQFVDLFSIGFVDKLMSAKVFDLLNSHSY